MKRGTGTRRDGMTLIEVLLALAIFLMAFVAIARLIDMGTDQELDARMNATAARLAQSKLGEVEGGAIPMDTPSGVFENDDASWQWTMTAVPQGDSTMSLFSVTVTVTHDYKGKTFSYSVSQMMIDPTMKGAATPAARSTDTSGAMP